MVGQNPARQASIASGIPVDKPATTINKVIFLSNYFLFDEMADF